MVCDHFHLYVTLFCAGFYGSAHNDITRPALFLILQYYNLLAVYI